MVDGNVIDFYIGVIKVYLSESDSEDMYENCDVIFYSLKIVEVIVSIGLRLELERVMDWVIV